MKERGKAALQRADVVCRTVSGLGEAAVFINSLHLIFFVMDEASQLLETEPVNSHCLVRHSDTQMLFIGDYGQSKPSVQMGDDNVWKERRERSLIMIERMMNFMRSWLLTYDLRIMLRTQ